MKVFIGIILGLAIVVFGSYFIWVSSDRTFDEPLPNKLSFYKYIDGAMIENSEVDGSDERYLLLDGWISKNRSGWNNDLVTYVDSVVFKSESMKINVIKGMVVINYKSDGEWTQISKKVESDLSF